MIAQAHPARRNAANRPCAARGFALVVTISLMLVLVVLAVGLLSLSAVSLRSGTQEQAMQTARANARMALMLAIGELQQTTGPDQRITMGSTLRSGQAPANPNWTGTVDVRPGSLTPDARNATIRWLVSGTAPDPAAVLSPSTGLNQGDALKLGTFRSATGATMELLAPVMNSSQGSNRGRFAWWIGDEGSKARVDLAKPTSPPATERDRLALAQAPLEAGLAEIGPAWPEFAPLPVGSIKKSMLISLPTASLAAQNPALDIEYFNDVTTGGYGLPVNVAAGGMKADLSLIFDRSQVTKPYGDSYFGATPKALSLGAASVYDFAIGAADKFSLSDAIGRNGSLPVGPNWGILWNHATIWRNVTAQQAPVVAANPPVESDMRFKTWLPYSNYDEGKFRKDQQHTNSPLTPVLSLFQISFRLTSERVAPPASNPGPVRYKPQITMQPVIGLWNPYNVAIRAQPYALRWALYPYFRINYAKPGGNGSYSDARHTDLWLREVWVTGSGNGIVPTPEDPLGSRFISVTTESVDLQPGEFRVFSALSKIKAVKVNDNYKLKAGWSEIGGFVLDLKASDGSDLIPEGYETWVGDIFFQDTQSPQTLARYPALNVATTTSSWISLGSQGRNILRTSDLWNSDNNPKVLVPEPVVSGGDATGTTKATYRIEDLADDQTAAHIATWSFFTRTTNQVEEAGQRLRGWIDSNPRTMVANPLWDGSRVDATGERSGWHTTSHWIGAYNPPGKPKVVGDGFGGNRGLLAEGGSAIPEPEMNEAGGRWQGYGGAANTEAGGRTNVIVYDVPRGPLVSLGQFQHAQLARYNFEPGFVVGNSYANPRIPLNATTAPDFNGLAGMNVTDISYDVNRKLWDGYFFSTLAPDYVGATGSFDSAFDFDKLASGASALPNPRMVFAPLNGDSSLDKILSDHGERAPEAIAARLMVKGAFNVNSTSKNAWKAVLASMGASELPVVNPQTRAVSWENTGGTHFNRFGPVLSNQAYEKGGPGDDDAFWQSWRKIPEAELDALAGEIVKEVQERGPFRSMAEFVNRNPNASDPRHRLKGPLQAALDATLNKNLPESVGKTATNPAGALFSAAVTDENAAVGNAAYVMQGDVLQSLAPILQVRSDYFRIRTCGETLDASGKVIARAWCEAFVQRVNRYVDPRDPPHTRTADLLSAINGTFGRRYELVSFRWLSPSEI